MKQKKIGSSENFHWHKLALHPLPVLSGQSAAEFVTAWRVSWLTIICLALESDARFFTPTKAYTFYAGSRRRVSGGMRKNLLPKKFQRNSPGCGKKADRSGPGSCANRPRSSYLRFVFLALACGFSSFFISQKQETNDMQRRRGRGRAHVLSFISSVPCISTCSWNYSGMRGRGVSAGERLPHLVFLPWATLNRVREARDAGKPL